VKHDREAHSSQGATGPQEHKKFKATRILRIDRSGKEAVRMSRAGSCAALLSPHVFARILFARLNRRAIIAKALARVTSCGGRIAVSCPADGRILPVILGLDGGQIFDPGARIHIQLPALSYAQSSELNHYLQSLATLTSLRIGGRHFACIDFPSNPCERMSTNEANFGCWYPQLMEPLLADVPE